jgi:hypothetical protein
MVEAGLLNERFRFEKRSAIPAGDGYGNFEGGWVAQFTVWCRRQMLRGGENVMAARLTGRQPAVLTVYSSVQSRTITTDWRAVDSRSGAVWNIRSIERSEDRGCIDLLCEFGVAP